MESLSEFSLSGAQIGAIADVTTSGGNVDRRLGESLLRSATQDGVPSQQPTYVVYDDDFQVAAAPFSYTRT